MELIASKIIFWVLALVIVAFSVLTVTSRKILRAATCLLFVLIATAGIYVLLDYHFLAAVQITVYAGGILVLYEFSILLTAQAGEKTDPVKRNKVIAGTAVSLAGILL
ncbi:MAG: NADH-quinone oxidoreductase subunit J, partial [Bacteroidales bacterium]|nr:NADH-quinone oxidoreductase subunit J [Bacteroidales bacterium]